jgi:Ulp1 family protease
MINRPTKNEQKRNKLKINIPQYSSNEENLKPFLNESAILPSFTNSAHELPSTLQVAKKFWEFSGAEEENIVTKLKQTVNSSQRIPHDFFNTSCTYYDIASLYHKNWLTGSVISSYLSQMLRFNTSSRQMLLLSHDFYAFLSCLHRGYDFDNVPQYLIHQFHEDNSKLLYDIIFPIHIPGHWILAIILPTNSCLILLDSMHHDRNTIHSAKAKNILRWYNDLCISLRNSPSTPISQWKIVSKSISRNEPLPLQTDSNSCGVFVAITAAYWVMHQRLPTTSDWTQQHMPKLRLHMAATLFENDAFNIMNEIQQRRRDSYIDLTKDELENLNIYDIHIE